MLPRFISSSHALAHSIGRCFGSRDDSRTTFVPLGEPKIGAQIPSIVGRVEMGSRLQLLLRETSKFPSFKLSSHAPIDCSKNISSSTSQERNEMAAGRESTSGRLEQLISGGRDWRTPGLVQVILGVVGPSQEVAGEEPSPPDRIVLVNPVTQGMVVLQGDPDLMAEILSERSVGDGGRGAGGPPPASKASIEAMRTVDAGEGEGVRQEECPVCLDGLGEGGKEESAAVVREMPCGHRFHEGCIVKWLGMHGSCPVCRFRMPPEEGVDPKKGDGEGDGDGAENEEQRRRRIRGMWLTIVYRRGRGEISDQASQSPGEEDGGGGYSGGDAAAVSAETDGGIERVDQ